MKKPITPYAEYSPAENVTNIMENVLFANIVEDGIKRMPITKVMPCLKIIATQNRIPIAVTACCTSGKIGDFRKADVILTNSVAFN